LQNEGIANFTKEVSIKAMKKYTFQYLGKAVLYKGKDIANDIGYEELAFKTAHLARKP
jgi:Mn-containing catalase